MTTTDPSPLLASLRDDRLRLAELPSDLGSGEVAACPGWTPADLLVHLGRVHRWATAALDTPPAGPPPRFPPAPPPGTDLIEWIDVGLETLIDKLADTDLDEPCWSFAEPQTARFWLRRQAIETATHRWDAERAVGIDPAPIDGEVAAAGIDEWCLLQASRWYHPSPDIVGSVHLHATDGEGEWCIDVDAEGLSWDRGHRKADVALRGSRSDLLLALQNRAAATEVLGDQALLEKVLTAAAV